MKKEKFGFGKIFYTEWLVPVHDYYISIKINEAVFEIIIPIFISVVCTFTYNKHDLVTIALINLAEILPTAISILIGFTVMLITLLLTSSGDNINKIKDITTEKKLHGNLITLYQGLHIQFTHTLFVEIELLLVIFLYLYISGFICLRWIEIAFLFLECYFTLNILFSIVRGITNLYFSFYKKK